MADTCICRGLEFIGHFPTQSRKKGRERVVAVTAFKLKATSGKKCRKSWNHQGKKHAFFPVDCIALFIWPKENSSSWMEACFCQSVCFFQSKGPAGLTEIRPSEGNQKDFFPRGLSFLSDFILLFFMVKQGSQYYAKVYPEARLCY